MTIFDLLSRPDASLLSVDFIIHGKQLEWSRHVVYSLYKAANLWGLRTSLDEIKYDAETGSSVVIDKVYIPLRQFSEGGVVLYEKQAEVIWTNLKRNKNERN